MSVNKKSCPEIRFPGFADAWEQRKFGGLLNETREKTSVENEDTLLSCAINGLYLNSELFSHFRGQSNIGYLKVKKNDLILSAQNLHLGNCNVNLRFEHGIISPAYKVYELVDCNPLFMQAWVKMDKTKDFFLRASTEGASVCRKNIVWEELYKQELVIPEVREQEKIGEYFSSLDNLITLHQRKCDALKKLKKCMLQKMFPKKGELVPEIRFPGFTDAWEQRKLGDYSELITKGTTPSSFCEDGNVTFVKIEALRGKRVVKELCATITEEIHRGELARSMLEENDIVFAIAGATVGKCAVITRDILPANTNQALAIIRLKSSVNRDFIYFSLTSKQMEIYLNQSKSVGAQPNLSLTQMNNFDFLCPSQKEEQQRIGDCFTNLDHLITLHQRKCDALKELKKGMLQKMFV